MILLLAVLPLACLVGPNSSCYRLTVASDMLAHFGSLLCIVLLLYFDLLVHFSNLRNRLRNWSTVSH